MVIQSGSASRKVHGLRMMKLGYKKEVNVQ
jgi:hypothetical protein